MLTSVSYSQDKISSGTTHTDQNGIVREDVIRLNSSGTYQARTDSFSIREQYRISDPTIRTMNANANGADIPLGNSQIAGMPKRAYGFAHGRLWLVNTSATSSGTITGNASIGSGSTLGSMGSKGPHLGINGKSPYSGSNMWGNARGMILSNPDASVRQVRTSDD